MDDLRTEAITSISFDGGRVGLAAGDRLSFGRTRADQPQPGVVGPVAERHLGLSVDTRLHAVAGRIEARPEGWLLVNEGRWLHLRVERIDGPDRIDLEPGRTLRVPWPTVRVELATGEGVVEFTVECPALSSGPGEVSTIAGDTVRSLDLDRTAGYFRALVALCSPRLRDPSSTEVATVAQVARTLSRLPVEGDRVSIKAVERRLAHVRQRVGLGAEELAGSGAGLEVRDASRRLVELALRTGTVTAADLSLLDQSVAERDATE